MRIQIRLHVESSYTRCSVFLCLVALVYVAPYALFVALPFCWVANYISRTYRLVMADLRRSESAAKSPLSSLVVELARSTAFSRAFGALDSSFAQFAAISANQLQRVRNQHLIQALQSCSQMRQASTISHLAYWLASRIDVLAAAGLSGFAFYAGKFTKHKCLVELLICLSLLSAWSNNERSCSWSVRESFFWAAAHT